MVRRLVEHEQVRPRQHQQQQLQPRALAAGEQPVRAAYLLVREQELHQQRRRRRLRTRARRAARCRAGSRPDRACPDPGRGTRSRSTAPTQTSPEVGAISPTSVFSSTDLPAPLRPTTPTRSPCTTVEVDAREHRVVAERRRRPRAARTRAARRGSSAAAASAILRRSSTGRSTVSMRSIWRCLLLAWRMLRLSGTQEAQSLKRAIAASSRSISFCWVTYCLLLALQLELALERVGRVVARPQPDPARVERGDLVDDLVEQVAVVRDGDDRARRSGARAAPPARGPRCRGGPPARRAAARRAAARGRRRAR